MDTSGFSMRIAPSKQLIRSEPTHVIQRTKLSYYSKTTGTKTDPADTSPALTAFFLSFFFLSFFFFSSKCTVYPPTFQTSYAVLGPSGFLPIVAELTFYITCCS